MGKKRSTIKCYEKLLREDRDYDYAYLLELEQFKLRRMVKNFSEAPVPHVGIEYTIRDLKMCVSLLDIILEKDAPYKTYLEENYGPNGKVKMSVGEDNVLKVEERDSAYKTPVHVNIRNYKRINKK